MAKVTFTIDTDTHEMAASIDGQNVPCDTFCADKYSYKNGDGETEECLHINISKKSDNPDGFNTYTAYNYRGEKYIDEEEMAEAANKINEFTTFRSKANLVFKLEKSTNLQQVIASILNKGKV